MKFPEIGTIFWQGGYAIAVTSVDLSKECGTFKLFQSPQAADDWIHAGSLEQSPEWHKTKCPKCLGEPKGNE